MNRQPINDDHRRDRTTDRYRSSHLVLCAGLGLVALALGCGSHDDQGAHDEGHGTEGEVCEVEHDQVVDVNCNDCTIYGDGKLHMNVWGENFIEYGIPATEMADGWAIKFDRFLVHVSRLSAKRDFCNNSWLEDPKGYITNIAQPSGGFGVTISTEVVPTGRYNNVGYSIHPASVNARPIGVSPEDYALMIESGYSMFLSGWAQRGAVVKRFAWGLRTDQTYQGCQGLTEVADAFDGLSVITVHGDHLFFNSYSAATAQVMFGIYETADKDGDGEITEAELRAQPVTQAGINPGPRRINTAWEWLEAVSREVGHVDGEQHCFRTEENSKPTDVKHEHPPE